MGSVTEKLNKLLDTKSRLKAALIEKGQEVTDTEPFSAYPDKVLAIQTTPAPGTPLDPAEVYKTTRPADWLPMPEPADNELYMLVHIPDGVSALLAFTATCTGNYTVSLGTVSDRKFVQKSAQVIATGAKYETELFASDFGDLTSTGMKQCMVKITGTDIFTWEPSTHSKKTSPANFCMWNIVEIVCRLPMGTKVACGNNSENMALNSLRYFSWYGTNKALNMNSMFYNCRSLTSIPQLNTTRVTSMSNMFYSCYSLTSIPQLDTKRVTSMSSMFNSCYSLTSIPRLNTTRVTNMNSMFYNCRSLTSIPQLNTAQVTNMSYMFYSCYSLTSIPQLDTAQVTNMSSMFGNCYSLGKITLNPSPSGWAGHAISLSECSLGHKALVDLFNSLPTITITNGLTLTGNPGISELTDAEKAIAIEKNWTLTL